MRSPSIEEVIKAAHPAADVTANVLCDTLSLELAVPEGSRRPRMNEIHQLLSGAGVTDGIDVINFVCTVIPPTPITLAGFTPKPRPFFDLYPVLASGGAGDQYDAGDDENRNWPSTTGNPSGGGRGNNPPRR